MAQTQEQIVQKMIDAGEPEENIATVIQSFKSQATPEVKTPDITSTPDVIPAANEPSPEFSGSYKYLPSGTPDTEPSQAQEPDTYWGGFFKGIKDYGKDITSGITSGLESAAHPKTLGDILSLVIPSELPHVARGNLGRVAESIAGRESIPEAPSKLLMKSGEVITPKSTKVTRIVDEGLPFASDKPETWMVQGHLDDAKAAQLNDMYKSGKGQILRGDVNSPVEFDASDEFGNLIGKLPTNKVEFNPASLGFKPKDEVGDLIKSAGLEEAPPIEVVGQETSKPDNLAAMQQSRSAAMDARNKGFRTSANDMSSSETRGFATQGNEPLAGLNPKIKALLDKNNQIAKTANETQKKGIWPEIRDANRALLTSFDFSAAGRQGKPLMLTKAYWTSLDDMFKSWGSERAYQSVMDSINAHPNFQSTTSPISGKVTKSLADRAGLSIGNAEQFQSNIAEKFIPGVRPSERAYNAFLNKLRADHFNTLVKDSIDAGVDVTKNDTELKKLGTFINDATGKGSLGKLERYAPILNEAFFAPKLMTSRVNMYKRWLNPMTYADSNPVIRKQALKSLLATVGFGMAVGELARLGGAQVNNDPQSSDFRKIKIGDTRIDPFAGHQQYAVGASRLAPQAIGGGYTTSSTTGKRYDLANPKFGGPSRASVASQFFQNKLAPVPSLVWSWMEGKDWNGQPFEIKKALLDRTVPLVMQDLYDVYKEDPSKFPAGIFKENPTATKVGLSVLPILGEGMQTYGR